MNNNNVDNLPKEIDEFCRNNPSKIVDNLYLCQSVDMNGNIIDTKIGVNKMTNYGLKLVFVNHSTFDRYIFLGSGKDSIDPTSSSLQSYISALGQGSITDSNTWRLAAQYDSQTHLFFCRNKLVTCMWEYTAGSNQEYEIWEIGCGGGSTSLVSHALIYDTEGNQTCIVKRPNTRLYVTLYWTNCVNVKRIQEAYDKGQYALIHPNFTFSNGSSSATLYVSCLVRSKGLDHDNPDIKADVKQSYAGFYYPTSQLNSDNTKIAESVNTGPGSNYLTWNENDYYTCGFLISQSYWHMWYNEQNEKVKTVLDFGLFTYDEIPTDGYDTMKHIECEDIYVNRSEYMFPYDQGNNYNVDLSNDACFDFDWCFGKSPLNDWTWSYYTIDGYLPCTQFDASSLSFYNHLTKEWDIPVRFINGPNTYYNNSHNKLYLDLWINYNGSARTVYVFVNPYTNMPIKKFSNSNMTLVATDTYWDSSTYEIIDNLNTVPETLQSKRYYIIVSGTLAVLNPVYDRNDRPIHRIDPVVKPYELTNGLCPKNVSLYSRDIDRFCGSNPISSDTYGYFLDDRHLVYVDNDKNVSYYEMDMGDNTNGCFVRRYQTINEDRIIMFHDRYCENTSKSEINFGYDVGKNKLRIFNVGNRDTEPTFTDMNLTFSTSTNNSTYHKYTFSQNGFLVAQRREGVNEAVVLDVYGDDSGPLQYIIPNCKHCHALNLTDMCVYLDTNATTDIEFSFVIYDMKNKNVIKTFTISNLGSYSIDGIWGWREFVFVNITDSSGTKSSYHYNIQENTMQQTTIYQSIFNTSNDWRYNFTQSIDECLVVAGLDYQTYVFRSNNILTPIRLASKTYCGDNENPNQYLRYIQIKRINEGKQIILSMLCGKNNASFTGIARCIDLGWILDNGPIPVISQNGLMYIGDDSFNKNHGSIYQLNGGVILLDGHSNWSRENHPQYNRLYWIPLEHFLRMKIVGETKTINTYNQPISLGNKTFSIQITNDWDLMVDDEDKV